jgi:hypothetical protein
MSPRASSGRPRRSFSVDAHQKIVFSATAILYQFWNNSMGTAFLALRLQGANRATGPLQTCCELHFCSCRRLSTRGHTLPGIGL